MNSYGLFPLSCASAVGLAGAVIFNKLTGGNTTNAEEEAINTDLTTQQQPEDPVKIELDMAKKDAFHFLNLAQKRLIDTKRSTIPLDDTIYPEATREIWVALENAVQEDDRETAENLRKQLFPNSGSLIKPKVTKIKNPATEDEKILNTITKSLRLCHESNTVSDILLSHGLGSNCLPLIYLALKCKANPEHLFKGDYGREHHLLKIALESAQPCDIAGIRLLFQFTRNPRNLANGAMMTIPLPRGAFSPLEKAFQVGRLDVVRELLAHGADPDLAWQKQMREESLFMFAVQKGHSEIVQFFLQTGFPVNYQDKKGCTALHLAKLRKNEQLVNDLLMAGADQQLTDYKGRNFLQFAEEGWKQFDAAAREKLVPAFQTGKFEHVYSAGGIDKLVSSLIDINESIDEDDNSLLHLAMKNLQNSYGSIKGILEIRQLIDLGADFSRKNKQSETPHTILQATIAAQEQRIDLIRSEQPLKKTGITLFQEVVNDALAEHAAREQRGETTPDERIYLMPIFSKRLKNEEKYLESLKSFSQFLIA